MIREHLLSRPPANIGCWFFVALCLFFLSTFCVNAQWVQTSGPTGGSIGNVTATIDDFFACTIRGVFRSTDRGLTWKSANAGLAGSPLAHGIVAFPNAAGGTDAFLATGYGVFRSTDRGSSWHSVSTGLTDRNVALLAVDTISAGSGYPTLYCATGSGVFRSTNGGSSWVVANSGMPSSSLRDLVLYPTPGVAGSVSLLAISWDRGVFLSSNGGSNWSRLSGGLPDTSAGGQNLAACTVAGKTYLYASYWNLGVYRSTDGGFSWSASNSGLSYPDVECFAWIPSGAGGFTLYAGTSGGGVFRSTNAGSNWTSINDGLSSGFVSGLGLVPRPAASAISLIAGTGGGVFGFAGASGVWTPLNNGLILSNVTSLAMGLAPGNNEQLILYAGSAYGAHFSTDLGMKWNPMNACAVQSMTFADRTVNALVVRGQSIYAATSRGVTFAAGGGGSWLPIDTGLTNRDVISFAI
jgi:hypothetical protein